MSNKRYEISGEKQEKGIARAALAIMGIGIAAGIALIAGAKKVGETMADRADEKKK